MTVLVWIALVCVSLACVARGQTSAVYDAALGTLPDDQGWVRTFEDPFTVGVAGGVLDVSTLPLATISCAGSSDQPQYVYWTPEAIEIDYDLGACLTAHLRVIASQYSVNPCDGWPRPGLAVMLSDEQGHWFWVGLGEDRVFLSNDPYAPFGSPGVVETSQTTTGAFRVYQLQVLGSHAELSVDGVSVLSLDGLGNPLGPGLAAYIGDGTGWANSHALFGEFSITRGSCPCPADIDGDGDADGDDFFGFLDLFAGGDAHADLDRDGDRDADDFFRYLDLFAAGC